MHPCNDECLRYDFGTVSLTSNFYCKRNPNVFTSCGNGGISFQGDSVVRLQYAFLQCP